MNMKVGKVILNSVVLLFILFAGYRFILYKPISNITVSCTDQYNGITNEKSFSCDVDDSSDLITTEHPLQFDLLLDDTLLQTIQLDDGQNDFTFDTLLYGTQYDVVISGYWYENDAYLEHTFYEDSFNTIDAAYTVPSITFTELQVGDVTYEYELVLDDPDSLTTNIAYELYDDSDYLIETDDLVIQGTNHVVIDGLSELSDYELKFVITYTIDTLQNTATFDHTASFTTLRTPLTPSAAIENFVNDNVNISFDLIIDDQDATNVVYQVQLRDGLDQILDYTETITQQITFDVSTITEDFAIVVVASFDFNGVFYEDNVLYSYYVYDNEYSTFFTIPTLSKIDTSVPLTNYNQYKDYLFTFIDQGITEFTITCDTGVDCTTLVEDSAYSRIPFDVAGFVHPYYSVNQISFSYTSTTINFTTTLAYTEQERTLIDSEVNTILNTIITVGMSKEDQILAVHDYIVNNAYYDEQCYLDSLTCDNDHSAYGILFDGNAVCEGYAHLADIMLRALGIETFRVSSETHQWNAVYVNDQWLHMDTTWDDPVVTHGPDIIRYDYYLITTSELFALDTASHTFDTTILNFMS